MLRKSEKGWMFIEERVLEDFLWLHLESSLDLIPLKRQFIVKCYLWLPSPKNLFRPMKVSGVSRMNLYCGTDFLEISSVTPCTQDGRFAAGSSMAIDVYLQEIRLELSEPITNRLFELAVKLNLERNQSVHQLDARLFAMLTKFD